MSKSQTSKEERTAVFPAGSTSGVIGELEEGEEYLFSISVSYSIHEKLYEGNKSNYTKPTIGKGTMLVFLPIHVLVTRIVFYFSTNQLFMCIRFSSYVFNESDHCYCHKDWYICTILPVSFFQHHFGDCHLENAKEKSF